MSVVSATGGNSTCLCTGRCFSGGCSAYLHGKENSFHNGYSTLTPPTFSEIQNFKNKINIDVESIRKQVISHEHTINHTQEGIEKCFERVENVERMVDVEKIRATILDGAQTHLSILKCEAKIKVCLEKLGHLSINVGDKIPNPFEYIAVDAKRRDDMTYIKKTLYEFYCWIINAVEENKERSKGIERLEEAAMWLNKSISRRKGNGTQDEK